MKYALFLLLLLAPALTAQTPVETIKVEIEAPADDPYEREICGLLRGELRKLRYVTFASKDGSKHFYVLYQVAPFDDCEGRRFAVSMVIEGARRKRLTTHVGGDLRKIAEEMTRRLKDEFASGRLSDR